MGTVKRAQSQSRYAVEITLLLFLAALAAASLKAPRPAEPQALTPEQRLQVEEAFQAGQEFLKQAPREFVTHLRRGQPAESLRVLKQVDRLVQCHQEALELEDEIEAIQALSEPRSQEENERLASLQERVFQLRAEIEAIAVALDEY